MHVANPTDAWRSRMKMCECEGCRVWDRAMIVPPVDVELMETSRWRTPPSSRSSRDEIGVVILSWSMAIQVCIYRADFAKRAFCDEGFHFGSVLVEGVPWSEYVTVFADNRRRVAFTQDQMISSGACAVCGRRVGVAEVDAKTMIDGQQLGGRPIVISDDSSSRVFVSEERWSQLSGDYRGAFALESVIVT